MYADFTTISRTQRNCFKTLSPSVAISSIKEKEISENIQQLVRKTAQSRQEEKRTTTK